MPERLSSSVVGSIDSDQLRIRLEGRLEALEGALLRYSEIAKLLHGIIAPPAS